jgi:hypothetical protein
MHETDRIVPNPRAVYRKLAEGSGGVVLHLDTAAYHGVNETGAYIWSLLDGGVTFGGVLERLRTDMEGAPDALEDEVRAFVEALRERNLVTVEPADAAATADGDA